MDAFLTDKDFLDDDEEDDASADPMASKTGAAHEKTFVVLKPNKFGTTFHRVIRMIRVIRVIRVYYLS